MMTKDDIFVIVKDNILEILPELSPDAIQLDVSMRDLGANSIDRADVVVKTMADVSLKMPLVKFASVSNIGGLVDTFFDELQRAG